MIAGLKPYPEYKESGVPWLGRIPSHWAVARIKSILRELDHRSADGDGTLLSLTRMRGLIPQSDASDRMHGAKTLVGYKQYHPGQIVMNRMQAWSGMFGAGDLPGLVSPDYAVFQIIGRHNVRFLLYRLKSADLVGRFAIESKGIGSGFNRLYTDRFGAVSITSPPPDEQATIVRFLDCVNHRLERAIRTKKKLAALLNEQKQAIIHDAVTCGLDSDVGRKPSGVALLGDIPEHWEVRRVRTLVHRIDQGVSPQAAGFLADESSWGVLKAGCVNRGVFRQTEHKRLADSFQIDPNIVVRVGDVLISRACGSPKLVGSVGLVDALDYRLILSDKTFRPVFRPFINGWFVVRAMNSQYFRRQVEQAISGAEGLANNLPLSSLRDFRIAVPPPEEASAIANSLTDRVRKSDAGIQVAEREIGLINEYQSRLIADAVTGQIDVREVSRTLPTETEGPSALVEVDAEDESEELIEALTNHE
jgi:type I restriction enzyme, S subunit